ncbi:hypothetical protein COCOBI_12-0290 [Coccomyxa sp. Obi]|nr:hypothetical protein COCOBI_12-0290 [Coccomyxa sp. Obi]
MKKISTRASFRSSSEPAAGTGWQAAFFDRISSRRSLPGGQFWNFRTESLPSLAQLAAYQRLRLCTDPRQAGGSTSSTRCPFLALRGGDAP